MCSNSKVTLLKRDKLTFYPCLIVTHSCVQWDCLWSPSQTPRLSPWVLVQKENMTCFSMKAITFHTESVEYEAQHEAEPCWTLLPTFQPPPSTRQPLQHYWPVTSKTKNIHWTYPLNWPPPLRPWNLCFREDGKWMQAFNISKRQTFMEP